MLRKRSGEAVDLWVRDEGEGLPVVLLHGFTGSGDSMSELVSPTTNRVIIPDLIGHGLSPAPDQLSVYRMEAMVGQLHHLIQEKLEFALYLDYLIMIILNYYMLGDIQHFHQDQG